MPSKAALSFSHWKSPFKRIISKTPPKSIEGLFIAYTITDLT